jgi:hypothetical protein
LSVDVIAVVVRVHFDCRIVVVVVFTVVFIRVSEILHGRVLVTLAQQHLLASLSVRGEDGPAPLLSWADW